MQSSAERTTTTGSSPNVPARLRLRPGGGPGSHGSAGTLLDGGWWPRSADPVAELPGLILALQAASADAGDLWPITHVLLKAAEWESHPRRLSVKGPAGAQVVRLGWFDTLPEGLLIADRADGRRIDLLTVPASTDPVEAHAAMERAAQPGNRLRTPALLAPLVAPAAPADQVEGDVEGEGAEDLPESSTLEAEGGRLRGLVVTP